MRLNRVCDWTGIKFSNDGKQILLSTNGGMISVLHAINGSVLHTFSVRNTSMSTDLPSYNVWIAIELFVYFQGYNNSKGLSLEACFTPDSQFVMIGEPKHLSVIFVSSYKMTLVTLLNWISLRRLRGRESPCVEHWERDEGRCAGWETSRTNKHAAV